jgi:hypothetical protein
VIDGLCDAGIHAVASRRVRLDRGTALARQRRVIFGGGPRLSRRRFLAGTATLVGSVGVLGATGRVFGSAVNVRILGAVGNGTADDTAAIQRAIDAARGGGTVVLPGGIYRTGTLHLRSGLTLRLEAGAVLLGSPDDADYAPPAALGHDTFADLETSDFAFALLAGDGLIDLTIIGSGTIDGNRTERGGPKPIALRRCRRVRIAGVRVLNAPNYAVSLLGCEKVEIDGVTVEGAHADGIDPDCCTDVRITNCTVDAADDGICLKASHALGERRTTERVLVSDCTVRSSSNALKLGSESSSGFRDVTFRRCTLLGRRAPEVPRSIAEAGGIAIEMVDGGVLERVSVTDITMLDVPVPLFVRLADRGAGPSSKCPGKLRDVTIRRVVATGVHGTSSITGLRDVPIEGITLGDVLLSAAPTAGENDPIGLAVPEAPGGYPRPDMFGPLPAHGLYCRHVKGLGLTRVTLTSGVADVRPGLVLDDVVDSMIDGLAAGAARPGIVLWMHDARRVAVRGLTAPPGGDADLRITGAESGDIALAAAAAGRVERGPGVAASALVDLPI